MAATMIGCAVVWGNGYTSTGVVVSGTTGEIQDTTFARTATQTELRDSDGVTVGLASHDLRKTWTITVVPSNATTIATARTNMDAMIPVAGTIVTVTDATSAITNGTHSGKYVLESARLRYSNSAAAMVDFDIVQYDANDVAVAVTEA